jgi:hypothetical protein
VLQLFKSLTDSQNNWNEVLWKNIQSIKEENPIIEDIFLKDNSNKIQFPLTSLLYHERPTQNQKFKLKDKERLKIFNLLIQNTTTSCSGILKKVIPFVLIADCQ